MESKIWLSFALTLLLLLGTPILSAPVNDVVEESLAMSSHPYFAEGNSPTGNWAVSKTPMEDGSSVNAVAFSPDGTRLATPSGSGTDTITIWDTSDWTEVQTLSGHNGGLGLAFSPDGTRLASSSHAGDDGMIKIWDTSDWTEILTITPLNYILDIAFSPDSTHLAACLFHRQSAIIWDVADGTETQNLSHLSDVSTVAYSPDGTRFATVSHKNGIRIWDTSDWTEIKNLSGSSRVGAFSHDGTWLATGDSKVTIWDTSDWSVAQTLSGHTDTVNSIAFTPDGSRLASGDDDGMIKIWNTSDWTEVQTLSGHSRVWSLSFSPNGTMLASGGTDWNEPPDGALIIWEGDSDGDGVVDSADDCPDTYSRLYMPEDDLEGCSWGQLQDDDNDGIPNYLDSCSSIYRTVEEVDSEGCPVEDSNSLGSWVTESTLLYIGASTLLIVTLSVLVVRYKKRSQGSYPAHLVVPQKQQPLTQTEMPNTPSARPPHPINQHGVSSSSVIDITTSQSPQIVVVQQWMDDQGRTWRRMENGHMQVWNGEDWQDI